MWTAIEGASKNKMKDLMASNWEDELSAAPDQKGQKKEEITRTEEL